MYMNIDVLMVIGFFALVATAAGWARMLYLSVRRTDPIREDSRSRAASARQAFKAGRQPADAPR